MLILKEPLYNKDIGITMEGGLPICKCDTYEGVPKVKGCIVFREKEHIKKVLGLEGETFLTQNMKNTTVAHKSVFHENMLLNINKLKTFLPVGEPWLHCHFSLLLSCIHQHCDTCLSTIE